LTSDEFEFAKSTASSFMNSARSSRQFGARTACGAFWYPLDHGSEFAFPAFMLDTRSERIRDRRGQGPAIMSEDQLNSLLTWLRKTADDSETVDLPKLVFSGSSLIPLQRDATRPGMWRREDGFSGYPLELREIVRCIVDNDISRVVFIGGDLHLSCFASISFSKTGCDRSVSATQIIASGLYAPLRFTNLSTSEVDWKGQQNGAKSLELDGFRVTYTPEQLTDDLSHFVKVGITPSESGYELELTAYDAEGKRLNGVKTTL
jgi:phosphodiesterase/alkaline phosphatase D-like protein